VLSRVPIRVRLTLAFAVAMALVLAATGVFVYLRLEGSLDTSINQGLRTRIADVAALAKQADNGLGGAGEQSPGGEETFAQILDQHGRVFDSTAGLGTPLLRPAELPRARQDPMIINGRSIAGQPVRLLAAPIEAQDQRLVAIVGASLGSRDSALAGLRRQLLIGAPIALLLASLLAYTLAAAALRPVEAMRRRAAAISASKPGQRLPVPPASDEVARLGGTLNEMLERLEAAHERERTFVENASHELRTPLALLKAEIELALDEPRSNAELIAALDSAGEETDRLTQLAEDLLLLARVDRGILPIRTSEFHLSDLLGDVAARFSRRAEAAGRRIDWDCPDTISLVADRLRIEQALANLTENALRHGAGTIRIQAREHDDLIELHVDDQGSGFPPEFLGRAFERFSRAEHGRTSRGTGLGISIVAAIAHAHQGTAHAQNHSDRGADVWLSLPHVRPPAKHPKPTYVPDEASPHITAE
jgi:two-component system OmpR family sensor kinase